MAPKAELHVRNSSSERMAQETVRLRQETVTITQTGRGDAVPAPNLETIR